MTYPIKSLSTYLKAYDAEVSWKSQLHSVALYKANALKQFSDFMSYICFRKGGFFFFFYWQEDSLQIRYELLLYFFIAAVN